MALVAHFDLDMRQIGCENGLLQWRIKETHIQQPQGFETEGLQVE